MKKLNVIVPALAILALGTAASVTGTVAWFSANANVTVSGMKIQAKTDSSLFIANGAGVALASITGDSVTLSVASAPEVKPVDMVLNAGVVKANIPSAYSTNPTATTAGSGSAWTQVGSLGAAAATSETSYDIDDYVVSNYVSIARKQSSGASYTLSASVAVTHATASPLNKALRVGMFVNGEWLESTDSGLATAGSATFTIASTTGTLNDNTAYNVCLAAWFEGEDSDCFFDNAASLGVSEMVWTITATAA